MPKIYATNNVTNYVPIHEVDEQLFQPTNKNEIGELAIKNNYEPRRSTSRCSQISMKLVSPLISRSVRARRRQAFLKTYKLSSLNDKSMGVDEKMTSEPKYVEKVKEVVIKVKLSVMSLASVARLGVVKPRCCFRPMVCSSLPASSSVRRG